METTTTLDGSEMKFMPTEWTNEKHSLYLKDIESTFVNQLNTSTDFFGLLSQKDKLSRQTQCNSTSPTSDQFKVLQGGRWKKIFYGRADLQLNKDDALANPWNQRFRTRCKHQALARETAQSMNSRSKSREEKVFSCELVTPRPHWSDQDLEGSDNEASDQNFIGEDIEGEKISSICSPNRLKRLKTTDNSDIEGGKASGICSPNRLKRLMRADNSNNDQACSSS